MIPTYELFLPLACVADIEGAHFSVAIVTYMSGLFASLTQDVILCLWKVIGFVVRDDNRILS